MLFKTDENLPNEVGELLRKNGHDAVSVPDQNLGGKPDPDVARACQSEKRVLMTLDLDFSDIRVYRPEDYHGIIILRPTVQNVGSIVKLTDKVIELLGKESLAGKLWIVDNTKVRIRGGLDGLP